MAVRIGELLLKEKRITPAQLQEALNHQKANGGKVGVSLVRLGFVTDEEITDLLSKQYGVPSINLSQFEIDSSVIKLLPSETVQKYQIVPLSRAGATLTIAITDPTNVFAMDDIKFMTGYNVEPVVASETSVLEAIRRYYPNGASPARGAKKEAAGAGSAATNSSLHSAESMEAVSKALEDVAATDDVEVLEDLEQIDVASLEKQSGEAPVIRLVNLMLMSAIQKGASDIHIEPYEKEFRIRYRIDGILYERDAAADEVPRRDHLARQDHGQAGHRREAAAPGRPHQDPLRRTARSRRSTSASPACRRCSAKRSSFVSSTRTS